MLQAEETQRGITIGELTEIDVVAKGVSPVLGGRRRKRRRRKMGRRMRR